jgi:hypothetical protein
MTLDGNYSTIDSKDSVYSIQPGLTSRITSTLNRESYAPGITAGDVIRYDTDSQTYVKAVSSDSSRAEVYGIVESYKAVTGSLVVVLNGSIKLPNSKIETENQPNTGENDIYYLSATPGFIKNIPPRVLNHVVKPIYQVAPHGEFTGLVRNYLGYRSIDGSPPVVSEGTLISFSQNMEYAVEYNSIGSNLFKYAISYSSGTFTKTLRNIVTLSNFNQIDESRFNDPLNYDIKVSNNGEDILIFDKSDNNKIYHIVVSGTITEINSSAVLKEIIDTDLPGNNVDKLWACDNELTCMTISSRALERPAKNSDYRLSCFDVSSKIKFFNRRMNSQNKNWYKVNENHAFGDVNANIGVATGTYTQLQRTAGIFRTYDIKCKGKNFSLSTISLIQDQIDYQSKITGNKLQRYVNIDLGITLANLTNYQITAIDGDNVTIQEKKVTNGFFGEVEQALAPESSPSNANYRCIGDIKQYRINFKDSSYYYEDMSYRDSGGLKITDAALFDIINSTPINSSIENKITVSCPTDNTIFYATILSNNFFNLEKQPFFSEDNSQIFRYYDYSVALDRFTPDKTNYGLIFNNNNSNISSFNLFATNTNYFICTPTNVTIDNTTTVEINNFHKAQFYETLDGVFFLTDEKIYKFNGSDNFEEQDFI